VPRVFRELDDRGIELAEFTLRRASLDEVFFALTGYRPDQEKPDQRKPDGEDNAGPDRDRELERTTR
jgi:oleandomycin transport system ATP-binding protein